MTGRIGLVPAILILMFATIANAAVVERVKYEGRDAFRLSDGRTEAVIVPALGRVMRYGFIGKENVLWNSSRKDFTEDEWKNYGGDKTWLAPQSQWPVISKRAWPPDFTIDRDPHKAEVLTNGRLRMTSGVAAGFGARVIREFSFDGNGDFVIDQTVEKISGAPLTLSIWSVTQIVPPDAIFLPLNQQSAYPNQFHWMTRPTVEVPVTKVAQTRAQVAPTVRSNFKIGVDATVAALASVKDGVAFVQRAPAATGNYPDGEASRPGFPVELWNNGDAKAFYNELELLSPLLTCKVGTSMKHAVRWSLHQLPSTDLSAPAVREAVASLMKR